MIRTWTISTALAAVVALATPVVAQDGATVMATESEEYGEYLTDGEGRTLYLFTTDTQGTDDADAKISCTGGCLQAWPPLYAEDDPEAGDGVDASMLGTVEHDGKQMVTYNGWPLYYFAKDEGSGEARGQGMGGKWYLVSPEGEKIEQK